MFKLTIISGPIRGTSYALSEGETSIGRQTGNTIIVQSSKISKRHCVIELQENSVTLKDSGSANGTFVNGILTKSRKLKPGDRISIGEFVFELVELSKTIPRPAPVSESFGNALQMPSSGGVQLAALTEQSQPIQQTPDLMSSTAHSDQMPKDLKGKVIWAFEYKLMPIFYKFNFTYEWRFICIALFGVFLVANLFLSISPMMDASHEVIIKEIGKRATFMARQISENNSAFLAARQETRTEIGMIERAEGVRLAVIVDLDNRIIAPSSKLNQYLSSGIEARLAVSASKSFRSGLERGILRTGDSEVVSIEPIKVLNPAAGKNVIIAMSIVSIDTSSSVPDVGEIGVVYSETFILTALVAGLILLILYHLTMKPLKILNEDMDKALKGDIPQVTHEFKFSELDSLIDIINSAIQRIPKEGAMGEFSQGASNPNQLIEEVIGTFRLFGSVVSFGLVAFDTNHKIVYLNSMFEEISGIRSDSALGNSMTDVARDQALGMFTSEILGRTPVGGEGVNEDFEFSGISYKIYSNALGSPGQAARGYLLLILKHET